VFELEDEEDEPLAERAQRNQDRGTERRHPPPPDPGRHGERADTQRNRQQTNRRLAPSQGEHHQPFENEPSVRRALIQPQRAGQLRQRAIAHVQRQHLLVHPQRPCDGQPVDEDAPAQRSYRDADPVRAICGPAFGVRTYIVRPTEPDADRERRF
jgi:hypothetical protein